MKILIDADALPVIAKELIIKTANRTQTMAVFVANRMTKLPPSPFYRMLWLVLALMWRMNISYRQCSPTIWSSQATFRLPMMC